MKFYDKWNKSKFNVYTSEEKTVLKLISKISDFIADLSRGVDEKTDLKGNHEGAWQGVTNPVYSEPGIAGVVLNQGVSIDTLTNANIEFNNRLNNSLDKLLLINKYGMVGDGREETDIFQRAINENDEIYIPNNFIIGVSKQINIEGKKKIISNGGTFKCINDLGLAKLLYIDNANELVIEGITFDMNLKGRTSIDINICNGYVIRNCYFTGYTAELGYYQTDGGIRVDKGINGIIENNKFIDHGFQYDTTTATLNRCIGIGGTSDNTLIRGNLFDRVNQAIVVDSTNIKIIDNTFYNVKDNDIYAVGKAEHMIISNNLFNSGYDESIVLGGVGDFIVTGNTFLNIPNKYIAITSSLIDVTISNNTFLNTTATSPTFFAYRDSGYTITNLIFANNNIKCTVLNTPYHYINFGNVENLMFVNNVINVTTIANQKIIVLYGSTIQTGVIKNNIISGSLLTSSAIESATTSATLNLVVESNIINLSRVVYNPGYVIKDMDYQTNVGPYIQKLSQRNILYGEIPTLGKWKKGDIVYNSDPTPGGVLGWVCTTGTGVDLGTWKSFGTIAS